MHSIHGTEGHQGIVYVKTTANSQPFEFPVSLQGVDNIVFTHPTEIDFGTIIMSEENRKHDSKKSKERRSIYVTNGDLWHIRITSVSSPTSDIRPQLVSGRGVVVKPGEKVEAVRVWYDVKNRRTTSETFVSERVVLSVENNVGRKFKLTVLVRALVCATVPFRPIEKYALTFPTIEKLNTIKIEERELVWQKKNLITKNGKKKKKNKENELENLFEERNVTFEYTGKQPLQLLNVEHAHINSSRTVVIGYPKGRKIKSGEEVTFTFRDRIPPHPWKMNKEDEIIVVTNLLKFPVRIEHYDARLHCVNSDYKKSYDPKVALEDTSEEYEKSVKNTDSDNFTAVSAEPTCLPISFGIIGPGINRTRVITLINPHSKPLKIDSTWTDMPSAKVARLTTFDPESVRISGWNGQMIYVFDKSHLIEEHHMKDEDSTHDAPCRPNKKQFSDMPGGCRQDYVSKIPVDGSAAGKVIETSGSDFMVPARGRAIFHIAANVDEDSDFIENISDSTRSNYTFGVLTDGRWMQVPLTVSFSTGSLFPVNDVLHASASLGKRHASVPIEVVSTHTIPVMTRVSVLQHSLDGKRGSQKGVIVRHNENDGLIQPNIDEPQISAWVNLDLSDMHQEIFGNDDLMFDTAPNDDFEDGEEGDYLDAENDSMRAAASEWVQKKKVFVSSLPSKLEAKKLRSRLDKIGSLDEQNAFHMKATVVVSNEATSLGDVDTVAILVNLQRPSIIESLDSSSDEALDVNNYSPSSFMDYMDDKEEEEEFAANSTTSSTFIVGAGQRSSKSKTLRVLNPTSKQLCFDSEPYIFSGTSHADTPDLAIGKLLKRSGGVFSLSNLLASVTFGAISTPSPKFGSVREGENAFIFEGMNNYGDESDNIICIEPGLTKTLGGIYFVPPKSAMKGQVLKSSMCVRNSFTLLECVDVEGEVSEAYSFEGERAEKEAMKTMKAKKRRENSLTAKIYAFIERSSADISLNVSGTLETITSPNFLAVFFAVCFIVTACLFAVSIINQRKNAAPKPTVVPVNIMESSSEVQPIDGTTRRVESQESQKNGDAATKLATSTLSNLNTSLEEKLKPSPPVATVSVLESKPLPPKSEASKLSPLKSPKTNNKESPRASSCLLYTSPSPRD